MNPEKPAIGVSCGDMEVFKPLIIKGSDADTRVLEVTIEADLDQRETKVRP